LEATSGEEIRLLVKSGGGRSAIGSQPPAAASKRRGKSELVRLSWLHLETLEPKSELPAGREST